MYTSQVLHHLYSLDTSSPDFLRYLYCLIRSDEKEQYLSSLQGLELIRLIDFLDGILGAAPITDDVFRRCLHKLRTICSHHAILPSVYTISGDLTRVGDNPVAFGGFSDVWEGIHNGSRVCIKHLRVTEQDREAVEKAFYKEAIIWKRLRHPNVVAFIGVTRNPLQFVSEWMPNGTLTEYVNENPSANRVGLLLDVAEGLNYLHVNHTSHGDLKGPNILVDRSGHARLIDFGFASIVRGLSSILVSKVQGYTARWAAPEVLWSDGKITREADIFAFGMVMVEVFTGTCPFSKVTAEVAISKIMDGERPDRPQEPGLTDSLWDVTRACWRQEPARRPAIMKVVGTLRECYMQCAADLHLFSLTPPRPVKVTVKKKNTGTVTMPFGFQSAYRRINEIAEELAKRKDGLKGKPYSELLKLCTRWNALPAPYVLGGVARQGDRAQRVSWVTEVWKGVYNGETVALKVLRLSQDNFDKQIAQQRFCAGALLMKQLKHDNILPFYGVSTTASDLSLVFPWYRNGNINQYLEKNPCINRCDLLLGAVKGLLFLHSNGVVHGALRPSHILIDYDGNARLSIAAHDTSSIHHHEETLSAEDLKDCSYMAPETRPRPKHNYFTSNPVIGDSPTIVGSPMRMGGLTIGDSLRIGIIATMGSDVYEMAMVIYEVLTGVAPHYEYRYPDFSLVAEGGIPTRARGAIDGLVRKLLEECWDRNPRKRPPIVRVYQTLKSRLKAIRTPRRRPMVGELPGALQLHVQSIWVSSYQPGLPQFYARFNYGNEDYTTSPTDLQNSSGEYTWDGPEDWLIEIDERCHRQFVSLEVLIRTGPLKRDKVYATGGFSLINSANKQIIVALQVSATEFVDVRILVTAV